MSRQLRIQAKVKWCNNTEREVEKLKETQEYRRYFKEKYNPRSRYYEGNRNYDDIEEIVFSDEEE